MPTAAATSTLRAEGIYTILTPEECVAKGKDGQFNLHPLVGGMPIDEAWKCLNLFADEVLPNLK